MVRRDHALDGRSREVASVLALGYATKEQNREWMRKRRERAKREGLNFGTPTKKTIAKLTEGSELRKRCLPTGNKRYTIMGADGYPYEAVGNFDSTRVVEIIGLALGGYKAYAFYAPEGFKYAFRVLGAICWWIQGRYK